MASIFVPPRSTPMRMTGPGLLRGEGLAAPAMIVVVVARHGVEGKPARRDTPEAAARGLAPRKLGDSPRRGVAEGDRHRAPPEVECVADPLFHAPIAHHRAFPPASAIGRATRSLSRTSACRSVMRRHP